MKGNDARIAALLSSVLLLTCQPGVAGAEMDGAAVLKGRISNVDTATRDLLRSEIDLEKFNLNYRLNAAKQGRWKGWRYFFFQENTLALTDVSLIANVGIRGSHLQKPKAVHKAFIANGVFVPGLIAFLFGGAGDAIELGVNEFHSLQAHNNGFSQTQARKYVGKQLAAIDRQLAERQRMVDADTQSDENTRRLRDQEGKLLSDFRDASVAEFQRFHLGASRVLARENTFYILDFGKNFVGAANQIVGIALTIHKHPHQLTAFGATHVPGSSLLMADPIVSRVAAAGAAKFDRFWLRRSGDLPLINAASGLRSDYAGLQHWLNANGSQNNAEIAGAVARMACYDAGAGYYINQEEANAAELRAGQRTAIQNMGMGLFVGGGRLPIGLLSLHAALHDHLTKHVAITNGLSLAGSIAWTPEVSVAMLDSLRIQLGREATYHRLKNNHQLPGQLLHARLSQLDQLQQQL